MVNLPTVPGDVLVGAATTVFGVVNARRTGACDASSEFRLVLFAALASVFFYMFGLADNDIAGVKEDGPERPIPAGEISLGAARISRGLCLLLAMIVGALFDLPPAWWVAAFALTLTMVVYNRTKWPSVMGLCRGLNVICGGTVLLSGGCRGGQMPARWLLLGVAAVWILYIARVTKYSGGESEDPAKRACVGFLIGALVYLQLLALFAAYWFVPTILTRNLLLTGAGLLIALRLTKRFLPGVSAS